MKIKFLLRCFLLILIAKNSLSKNIFDPCISSPCNNNGVCIVSNDQKAYSCKCYSGWMGTDCNTVQPISAAQSEYVFYWNFKSLISKLKFKLKKKVSLTAAPLIVIAPVLLSIIILGFYIYLDKITKCVSKIKYICAKPTTYPTHSQLIYSITSSSSNFANNEPLSYEEALIQSVHVYSKSITVLIKKDILPSYNEALNSKSKFSLV